MADTKTHIRKPVLLAPNGKPSNLSSEQYRLVRTPEFISWFGDWKTNANIGHFVGSDNIKINLSDEKYDDEVSYRKSLFDSCGISSKGIHFNKNSGINIRIGGSAIKKIFWHSANIQFAKTTCSLSDMIRNCVFIKRIKNIHPKESQSIPFYLSFFIGVEVDGIHHTAYLTVKETRNKNDRYILWDYTLFEIEKSELVSRILLSKHGRLANSDNFLYGKDNRLDSIFQTFPEKISKVLDSNGEPLVVWHGSKQGVAEKMRFESDELGIHFGTREQASRVSDLKDGVTEPFFLNMKNPLHTRDFARWEWYIVSKMLNVDGVITDRERDRIQKARSDYELIGVLKGKGYDGIIYDNEFEGEGRSYIPFEKSQIRFAIGENTIRKTIRKPKRFAGGGDLENSGERGNFIKNITKDEIRNVISGKSKVRNGDAIQAAAAYLREIQGANPSSKDSKQVKAQEGSRLKKYAISNDIWLPETDYETPVTGGGEQDVYFLGKSVIKTNFGIYYNSWLDYLNNLLLHNLFFPDTAYELIGFTTHNDFLVSVVRQELVESNDETNLEEVTEFLSENGFNKIKNKNDYYSPELGIVLEDLHDENVLTKDGFLYFIDTVFYIKKTNVFEGGGAVCEITFDNFHDGTFADFMEIEAHEIPTRNPDFISSMGSEYWYDGGYVFRRADHWGEMESCTWLLNSESHNGLAYGKCKLSDFVSVVGKFSKGGDLKRKAMGKTIKRPTQKGRLSANDVKEKSEMISNKISEIKKQLKWHIGKTVAFPVTENESKIIKRGLPALEREFNRIWKIYLGMKDNRQGNISADEVQIKHFELDFNYAARLLDAKYIINYFELNKTNTIDGKFHSTVELNETERNIEKYALGFCKAIGKYPYEDSDFSVYLDVRKRQVDRMEKIYGFPQVLLQLGEQKDKLEIVPLTEYMDARDNRYKDYVMVYSKDPIPERKSATSVEINPLVKQAIADVITLDKYSKLEQEEGEYLYFIFRDYESQFIDDEYLSDSTFNPYENSATLSREEEEKKFSDLLESLYHKEFAYYSIYYSTIEAYRITIEFINAVRGRIQTLRNKQSGTDLFPETDINNTDMEDALNYLKDELKGDPDNQEIKDAIEYLQSESVSTYDDGGELKYYEVRKDGRPILKAKFGKAKEELHRDTVEMLDKLSDRGYVMKEISETDYRKFDYAQVNSDDLVEFTQGCEWYEGGGKIEFDRNKIPSARIYNYAIQIKNRHPEIWKKGGNIFGNQAFRNLEKVIKRGHWLESEKWMFIKWRSYVARHKGDFRIEGVVAMLKWIDTVDKGWEYMKETIGNEISKKTEKFCCGGESKSDAGIVTVTGATKQGFFYFDVNEDLTIGEVLALAKEKSSPNLLKWFKFKETKYEIEYA